jgi:hypothetical protein
MENLLQRPRDTGGNRQGRQAHVCMCECVCVCEHVLVCASVFGFICHSITQSLTLTHTRRYADNPFFVSPVKPDGDSKQQQQQQQHSPAPKKATDASANTSRTHGDDFFLKASKRQMDKADTHAHTVMKVCHCCCCRVFPTHCLALVFMNHNPPPTHTHTHTRVAGVHG